MLHAFISSRALHVAPQSAGGLASSVAMHAALVGFTVMAHTLHTTVVRSPGLMPEERILFASIAPRVATASHAVATAATHRVKRGEARATSIERMPDLADVSLDLAEETQAAIDVAAMMDIDGIGETDFEAIASGGMEFDRQAIMQFSGMPRRVVRGDASAYAEFDVEKVVAAYGTNPRPRYPAALQAAAVEDEFIVRFIVDSTGRVDKRSLVFPLQAHQLFVKSVRDALNRSRYIPAELAGKRVAQLVSQRFSFVIRR